MLSTSATAPTMPSGYTAQGARGRSPHGRRTAQLAPHAAVRPARAVRRRDESGELAPDLRRHRPPARGRRQASRPSSRRPPSSSTGSANALSGGVAMIAPNNSYSFAFGDQTNPPPVMVYGTNQALTQMSGVFRPRPGEREHLLGERRKRHRTPRVRHRLGRQPLKAGNMRGVRCRELDSRSCSAGYWRRQASSPASPSAGISSPGERTRSRRRRAGGLVRALEERSGRLPGGRRQSLFDGSPFARAREQRADGRRIAWTQRQNEVIAAATVASGGATAGGCQREMVQWPDPDEGDRRMRSANASLHSRRRTRPPIVRSRPTLSARVEARRLGRRASSPRSRSTSSATWRPALMPAFNAWPTISTRGGER